MARYLLKRTLPGCWRCFSSSLVFFLTRSDPRRLGAHNMPFAPPEMKAAVREQLGLMTRSACATCAGGICHAGAWPLLHHRRAGAASHRERAARNARADPRRGPFVVLGTAQRGAAQGDLTGDGAGRAAVRDVPPLAFGLEHLMGQSFRGVGSWQQLVMTQYCGTTRSSRLTRCTGGCCGCSSAHAAVLLLVVVRRVLRWRLSPSPVCWCLRYGWGAGTCLASRSR